MSFTSRHSPRFSYATGTPACPTELLGQSTFWERRSRPRVPVPQAPVPQSEMDDERFYINRMVLMSKQDRALITFVGVGIMIALLVDAVAHSKS